MDVETFEDVMTLPPVLAGETNEKEKPSVSSDTHQTIVHMDGRTEVVPITGEDTFLKAYYAERRRKPGFVSGCFGGNG